VLVRRIARPLLASTFIYGGLDALRHPEAKAPKAEVLDIPNKPGMDKLNITSTEQAVRVNAAVQVGGGTLLALNKFPRLSAFALAGSLVPTTAAGHRFWEETEPEKKVFQKTHFFKNLSMLGGLLIAAVDTEGNESLAKKTKRVSRRARRKAAKNAAEASGKVGKVSRASKKASKKASEKAAKKAGKAHKGRKGRKGRKVTDVVREVIPS
jgi:putative oxidoreductase